MREIAIKFALHLRLRLRRKVLADFAEHAWRRDDHNFLQLAALGRSIDSFGHLLGEMLFFNFMPIGDLHGASRPAAHGDTPRRGRSLVVRGRIFLDARLDDAQIQ